MSSPVACTTQTPKQRFSYCERGPMSAPAFTFLSSLSNDELVTYSQLRNQLSRFSKINKVREAYYEGSQIVRQLEIAIPPHLKDLEVVAGWAGTALDVLEERLNWEAWASSGDLMGLDQVYRDNNLDVESSRGHLDALIAGIAFGIVGRGGDGEPEILITPESPSNCTVIWDPRARRVVAALNRIVDYRGVVVREAFYLPNQSIYLEPDDRMRMVVADRDQHGLDRVPVSRLPNRSRSSRTGGRSEITGAVRYLTDASVRTMLGMEINREFYTTPQRWAMGANMSSFKRQDGSVVSGWEAVMGAMLAIPRDSKGNIPQVGQFTAAPPTPYIEQIRAYALLLAAEIGIPASYLGYTTENPASADAIRAGETRLVMRTENRQQGFSQGWRDVAYNAILWRDGKVNLDEFSKISLKWRDAATPTRAAAADEVMKLVSVEVLPPDSSVTYDRLSLSPAEQLTLAAEKKQKASAATADEGNSPPPVRTDLTTRTGDTNDRSTTGDDPAA